MSLQTRLLPQVDLEVELFELFYIHRSFQRILFSNIQRLSHLENLTVSLHLLHPILIHPVTSTLFDMKTIHTASMQTDMTCSITGDEVLARVCTDGAMSTMHLKVNMSALQTLCVNTIYAQLLSHGVGEDLF